MYVREHKKHHKTLHISSKHKKQRTSYINIKKQHKNLKKENKNRRYLKRRKVTTNNKIK
jgi:hypothetical protein